MWVVAELDDDYITKMEDVLELYERPYNPQEPVICLDEKPITLHADLRPASPAVPGREARRDNEYERRGTANVFCAVEPKAGRHFTFATPDRSGFEFAQVAVTLACLSQLAGLAADKSFRISEGVSKVSTTNEGYSESGLGEEIRRRGAWPYARS